MNELYTCQCRDGKTVSGFSRWSLTELKLMNPLELAAVLQELRDYARYYEATFFYPALSLQNEETALIRRFQRTKHHTACCGAVTGVLGAVWLLLVLIPAFRFSQLTMLMALLTLVSIIVLIPFLFLLVSAQEDYGKRLPRIHAKQGKLAQQEEREIYGDYLDYLIGGYLISPEYSLCSEALEMMRKALCAKQASNLAEATLLCKKKFGKSPVPRLITSIHSGSAEERKIGTKQAKRNLNMAEQEVPDMRLILELSGYLNNSLQRFAANQKADNDGPDSIAATLTCDEEGLITEYRSLRDEEKKRIRRVVHSFHTKQY